MGAGIHGGFGGTKGTEGQNAPVTAIKDVRYSKKKTEGYLLNPNQFGEPSGEDEKAEHDQIERYKPFKQDKQPVFLMFLIKF